MKEEISYGMIWLIVFSAVSISLVLYRFTAPQPEREKTPEEIAQEQQQRAINEANLRAFINEWKPIFAIFVSNATIVFNGTARAFIQFTPVGYFTLAVITLTVIGYVSPPLFNLIVEIIKLPYTITRWILSKRRIKEASGRGDE